jgi:hypothetical protein
MSERQQSVFISYSHSSEKEREWVRKLAKKLSDHKFSVWFDEWNLRAGDNLAQAIEKGLRNSGTFVTVLSRGSESRPNLLFELGVAIGSGKLLIPIVSKDVDSSKLPFEIRSRRFLPMSSPDETARQLIEAIQQGSEESHSEMLAAVN